LLLSQDLDVGEIAIRPILLHLLWGQLKLLPLFKAWQAVCQAAQWSVVQRKVSEIIWHFAGDYSPLMLLVPVELPMKNDNIQANS